MSDSVTLNPGSGGSVIQTEDIKQDDGTTKEMPVSKLYTGDKGQDGGPASETNPFPTLDRDIVEMLVQVLVELKAIKNVLQAMASFSGPQVLENITMHTSESRNHGAAYSQATTEG